MLRKLMKKLLAVRPQENFPFFLVVSFSFHFLFFSLLIRQSVMEQTVHPFTIEVDLVGMKEGGGGGGGGKESNGLKVKGEKLKENAKKDLSRPLPVQSKENIVSSLQKAEEEKKVASITESPGMVKGLERTMEGGGTGAGTGGGSGSGTGSGVGSGIGSGVGSGVGSGAGAGHGEEGSGVRDELREFKRKIKERIERVKSYPLLARRNQYEGTTSCAFTLLKGGDVKDIWVVEKSGYSILDEAAKKAIREAAPYPPFPSCIEGSSVEVKVPLVFKLKDLES